MSAPRLDGILGAEQAKHMVATLLGPDAPGTPVLLHGPPGGVQQDLAQFLAQGWLCAQPEAPCGQCPVCRTYQEGRAVDFLRIGPWGAGSNIRLAQIIQVPRGGEQPPHPPLQVWARVRALTARRKVAWIDRIDRVTTETANSLLKMLEEKGDHTRIVLTTDAFSLVPPTIRSRCLCIPCALPTREELAGGQPLSEVEELFGESAPRYLARIRQAPDTYRALLDEFERLLAEPRRVLLAAETCRDLGNDLAPLVEPPRKEDKERPTRPGHLEVLRCWSLFLLARRPFAHQALQRAVEAHRLIRGNVTALLALEDAFFEVDGLEMEPSPAKGR